MLKYALTCGVNAAARARTDSAVKRFYLKQIAKWKSPQDAQVAAARKLACIVWKILTSKQRYVEEDRYLTARKMRRLSQGRWKVPRAHDEGRGRANAHRRPEIRNGRAGELSKEMHRTVGHRGRRGRSKASIERAPEAGGVVAK